MSGTLQVFADSLKERYTYCPETGAIHLRGRLCTSRMSGGKYLKAGTMIQHRLAWFLHTGEQPPASIDHINLDGHDNRWCNLRAADRSENQRNIEVHKRNSTGIKGIMYLSKRGLYKAEVCLHGVRHQKTSKNIEPLQQWVIDKRNELHQSFARN